MSQGTRRLPVIRFESYNQTYEAMVALNGPPELEVHWPLDERRYWGKMRRLMAEQKKPFQYTVAGVSGDLPHVQILWLVREPEQIILTLGSPNCPTERELVKRIRQLKPSSFELAWPAHYVLYLGAIRTELRQHGLDYEITEVLEQTSDWKRRLIRRIRELPEPDPDLF